MALSAVALGDIPALAAEIETEARALAARTELSPAFLVELEVFSNDSMRLSDSLREAGVTQDLPCIFRGISEDARERVGALQAAGSAAEREAALTDLRVLLEDAILLAPMAAGAAADTASLH
jgi:hypothetical protein